MPTPPCLASGLVPSPEPFKQLLTQGMVRGETFRHPVTKLFVKPDRVEIVTEPGRERLIFIPRLRLRIATASATRRAFLTEKDASGKEIKLELEIIWEKMSKSKYNGVDPSVNASVVALLRCCSTIVTVVAGRDCAVGRGHDAHVRAAQGAARERSRLVCADSSSLVSGA